MSRKIESILNELYYNLTSPVAYASKTKLFHEARNKLPDITQKEVNDWLKTQLPYSLHRPVKLNFRTRPVIVHSIDEQWQIDLVDMSKLSRVNDGYKFIMVVIDVLSKYAWLIPLKSKHGKEIKHGFDKLFAMTKRRPQLIQTDKGTEFLNHIVQSLLQVNNIRLFTTNSERKASIVERLNRTMKGIMFRYFTKKNTRRYIDVLQDLTSKYNNSYHRSIKMAPVNVTKENEMLVWVNLYEKKTLTKTLNLTRIKRWRLCSYKY